MYRKRRLGVKEGNAIEDIVAFEMRQKRGVATTADKLAHDRACQFLGIKKTATNAVHPAFQGDVQDLGDDVLPINYIVNQTGLKGIWLTLKFVGVLFAIWALGCVLIYMVAWSMYGLVSLAHP